MKALAVVLLLAAMPPAGRRISPEPRYFKYSRVVAGATVAGRQVCTVLDAGVMAHAQSTLADPRLMVLGNDGQLEVPYAMTMSQTVGAGTDQARVLRRVASGARQVVELEMPARPYSEVHLLMGGKDFFATARVTGLRSAGDRAGVPVGTFTLFDLTAQKLGRDTTLRLAEASFPVLRVELEVSGTEAEVTGAEVPPSREAQTVFTTVAEAKMVQRGRESVATFELPARVPVERVRFEIADQGNFSREVKLRAQAVGSKDAVAEEVSAEIARVRLSGPEGQQVREEKLWFAATLGSNVATAARVEVAVENGDQPPLTINKVRLEMRRREICFESQVEPVTLFYGDPDLAAPSYDYARDFQTAGKTEIVGLGAEKRNPRFIGRDDSRSVSERHPELVWLVLMGVVGVFAVVGFRALRGQA